MAVPQHAQQRFGTTPGSTVGLSLVVGRWHGCGGDTASCVGENRAHCVDSLMSNHNALALNSFIVSRVAASLRNPASRTSVSINSRSDRSTYGRDPHVRMGYLRPLGVSRKCSLPRMMLHPRCHRTPSGNRSMFSPPGSKGTTHRVMPSYRPVLGSLLHLHAPCASPMTSGYGSFSSGGARRSWTK